MVSNGEPPKVFAGYHKNLVKFVIQWMLAGGAHGNYKHAVEYPREDADKLAALLKFSAQNGIAGLVQRTKETLLEVIGKQAVSFKQFETVFNRTSATDKLREILVKGTKAWTGKLSEDVLDQMYSVPTYNAQVSAQNSGLLTEAIIAITNLRNEVKEAKEEAAIRFVERKVEANQESKHRGSRKYKTRKYKVRSQGGHPTAHSRNMEGSSKQS